MHAPEPGAKLVELLDYQDDGIVSRRLLQSKAGHVTLFAFDEGQELSEHTAKHDVLLQVLEGPAQVTLAGVGYALEDGQAILLPAHKPHAVRAAGRFKMLLTTIGD